MSRGYDFDDQDFGRGQESESQPVFERGIESPPRGQRRVERKQASDRFPIQRSSERRIPGLDRPYELSDRERGTLREIGRFRTVDAEALLKHRYNGMASALRNEIARLLQVGLLKRRSISVGKNRNTLVVLALTKEGVDVVRGDDQLPENQVVYAGFVKPAEVPHDAAIYQMYQAEAAEIEAKGGKIKRVVLDYELKSKVYSKLARERDSGALEYLRTQQEIAAEHGLPVVDGKIALPDLRIEYETPEGELDRADLELATEHYHRGHMAAKARAGFKMYGFVSTSRGRRAQWEGRELTATVIAL